MAKNSLVYWIVFAYLTGAGLWIVYRCVRDYRLSGFRFYLTAGLVLGLPFLAWAVIFYYFPGAGPIPFLFVLITTRIGAEWAKDAEENLQQADPERWKVWQIRQKSKHWIGRLFL